jgi:hypothetical protein
MTKSGAGLPALSFAGGLATALILSGVPPSTVDPAVAQAVPTAMPADVSARLGADAVLPRQAEQLITKPDGFQARVRPLRTTTLFDGREAVADHIVVGVTSSNGWDTNFDSLVLD